jgi:RNA polymerase-interacting CarD/CdnL/TRCF family regulator
MFYVVKMEQSKLTIRVPIEKQEEVGLRKISSKKIINEVYEF